MNDINIFSNDITRASTRSSISKYSEWLSLESNQGQIKTKLGLDAAVQKRANFVLGIQDRSLQKIICHPRLLCGPISRMGLMLQHQ